MVTPNKVSTQCSECGKKYKVNLGGVEAQYVKFTCKNCHAANVVENPSHNSTAFQWNRTKRATPRVASAI
jgi:cytochrome c5